MNIYFNPKDYINIILPKLENLQKHFDKGISKRDKQTSVSEIVRDSIDTYHNFILSNNPGPNSISILKEILRNFDGTRITLKEGYHNTQVHSEKANWDNLMNFLSRIEKMIKEVFGKYGK